MTTDRRWLDYEVMGAGFGDQTIVARYRTADDIEIDALRVPDGTLADLVAQLFARTDQNIVTDILAAEQLRHAERRSRRMSAMHITVRPDHPLSGPIARLGELGERNDRG